MPRRWKPIPPCSRPSSTCVSKTMDRLIYTVLTGLGARSRSQTVTANNLANAETTGFRREIIAAEGRYLASDSATTRAQAGAPSLATPRQAGKIIPTGRPLDIALSGDAWLALQGPLVNGRPTEHYSRRGDLTLDPDRPAAERRWPACPQPERHRRHRARRRHARHRRRWHAVGAHRRRRNRRWAS